MPTVADNIREARKRAGLTQEQAAAGAGVSKQSVSGWERGAYFPNEDNLVVLARVYGVSPAELRYGTGDPEPPPEPASFSQRARAFVNRFMAELADAGVTEDEESWARRVLMSPDNYGFNAGGNTPTLSEEASGFKPLRPTSLGGS